MRLQNCLAIQDDDPAQGGSTWPPKNNSQNVIFGGEYAPTHSGVPGFWQHHCPIWHSQPLLPIMICITLFKNIFSDAAQVSQLLANPARDTISR